MEGTAWERESAAMRQSDRMNDERQRAELIKNENRKRKRDVDSSDDLGELTKADALEHIKAVRERQRQLRERQRGGSESSDSEMSGGSEDRRPQNLFQEDGTERKIGRRTEKSMELMTLDNFELIRMTKEKLELVLEHPRAADFLEGAVVRILNKNPLKRPETGKRTVAPAYIPTRVLPSQRSSDRSSLAIEQLTWTGRGFGVTKSRSSCSIDEVTKEGFRAMEITEYKNLLKNKSDISEEMICGMPEAIAETARRLKEFTFTDTDVNAILEKKKFGESRPSLQSKSSPKSNQQMSQTITDKSSATPRVAPPPAFAQVDVRRPVVSQIKSSAPANIGLSESLGEDNQMKTKMEMLKLQYANKTEVMMNFLENNKNLSANLSESMAMVLKTECPRGIIARPLLVPMATLGLMSTEETKRRPTLMIEEYLRLVSEAEAQASRSV